LAGAGWWCGGGSSGEAKGVDEACPAQQSTVGRGAGSAGECLCVAGWHGSNGVECEACPGGYTCPGGISVLKCPVNSVSVNNECVCVAGFFGEDAGACAGCPVGAWCEGGAHMQECSANMVTLTRESASEQACVCREAHFWNASTGACEVCVENHFCAGGVSGSERGAMERCPVRQVTESGASRVEACRCEAGWHGSNGVGCEACPAGYTCPGGVNVLACPQHSVSFAGVCVCAAGYAGASADACEACAYGEWCAGGGAGGERCPEHANTSTRFA
jgi:hypothetical protein